MAAVWAGSASAQVAEQAGGESVEAWLNEAESAEATGDIEGALASYQRIVDEAPSHRAASRARRRISALTELLGPDAAVLAELEQVKRAYRSLGSDAALERVRSLQERATSALGRARLTLWLGDEYLYMRQDADTARSAYLEVIAADGASARDYANAFAGAVLASPDWDDVEETRAALTSFEARHPELVSAVGADVLHDELDDRQQRMIWVVLGVAFLVALLVRFALARGWRAFDRAGLRQWRPWRAGLFLTYAFTGGGFIAEHWEHGFFWPFAACAGPVWLVHLVAVGATRAREEANSQGARMATVGRVFAALTIAGATLAAVFFTLSWFGRQDILGM